eukprot:851176-Prymnesium_polylepis.1
MRPTRAGGAPAGSLGWKACARREHSRSASGCSKMSDFSCPLRSSTSRSSERARRSTSRRRDWPLKSV